jgi:hypothetical protein
MHRVADAVAVLESQVRIQKLDFWVRNPDFSANELLNEFERCGNVELLARPTRFWTATSRTSGAIR